MPTLSRARATSVQESTSGQYPVEWLLTSPGEGFAQFLCRPFGDPGRPAGFTHEVVFRRCLDCRELNIVREEDFICVFCGSELPDVWNAD